MFSHKSIRWTHKGQELFGLEKAEIGRAQLIIT